MPWVSPTYDDLRTVVSEAHSDLLLCSPFVGAPALHQVHEVLDAAVRLEIWTRLNARDWISGATDILALASFIEGYDRGGTRIAIRQADHLHAKIVVSDDRAALVGSANLTRGGFARNLEASAVLSNIEVKPLLPLVAEIRDQLSPVSLRDFYLFADKCKLLERDRETVIELIQGEAASLTPESPLITIGDFIRRLQSGEQSETARRILQIRFNLDDNNRTGHLKQSFYAVQRFLRENRDLIAGVSNAPDAPYQLPAETLAKWLAFFRDHRGEADESLDYSFEVLYHVLPTNLGGTQVSGGGAGTPFRLVWHPVALLLQDRL